MISAEKHLASNIAAILAQKELDTNPQHWRGRMDDVTRNDVEDALSQKPGFYSFERLLTLVSPAAENYLEEMAQAARQLTIQRFGRTIKLYAPLYVSNYCVNSCLYCGFNCKSSFTRKRLTIDQALKEADLIASEGFTDILLVSGEDSTNIGVEYLAELARRLREKFSFVAVEIYSMSSDQYARLFEAGIEGVTLYQETYDRKAYGYYHPAGPKADYDRRLIAPDQMAVAGMREIGLGALLGLTDWRTETLALAEHAHYLMKRYWQSHISFSFPRLRPAHQVERSQFQHLLSDKNLAQMMTALRLSFADAGMVLSTREPAWLRDHFINIGITRMSAGSKTNPGGYSGDGDSGRQFDIDDSRSPAEIAAMLIQHGLEPVWKDWDRRFIS